MVRAGWVLALAGVLTLAGCAQPEREAGAPSAAQDAARRAGEEARRAARDAGVAAREAAREALQSARGAARGAERTAENAVLTAKVKNALLIARDMETARLDVDTTAGGVVTLRGQVPTAAMKRRAARIAREVAGVREVRNRLTVAPERSPTAN